jgi:hypothetical protein
VRGIRIVLACLVGALGIVAVSTAAHATAPTPPYNILTVDDTAGVVGFAADYAVDLSQLTPDRAASSDLRFAGSATPSGDSPRTISFEVWTSDQTPFAAQTYDIASSNGRLLFGAGSSTCTATSGTLQVLKLTTDLSGDLTSFAADFQNVTCAESPGATSKESGAIRWATDAGFSAVQVSPRSWDFGDQPLNVSSQPVTITFTNSGTTDVSFTGASLAGATGAFSIPAVTNNCSGTIAAGSSCTLHVVAKPSKPVSSSFLGSFATLTLHATGVADRVVKLAVEGNNFITTYALAGPQLVHVHWRRLPVPLGAVVDHYQVKRGTSPHALTFFRNVTANCCPIDTVDHGVTAGTTYYYSIQPILAGGTPGVTTPVVAADPWPKYGPGMYHRVGPSRILAGHVISAGHPFTLHVLGQHGLPGSGVSAVALDLLGANANTATKLAVFPTGSRQPAAADLALSRGQTATNFVITKVGSGGRITISTSHGSAKVTLDLTGFFSGSGLATSYGQGGALIDYSKGGTIMDTKGYRIGALKHDYYVNAPVNFDPAFTRHVTSMLLEVTAYGSTAPGTITAFRTNGRPSSTTVLAYGSGGTWSNTAVVANGVWTSPSTGDQYPSVSFLNRGPKPVQLKVAILGFVDDNTALGGERYYPTDPKRLLASTLGANVTRTVSPGSYGHAYTTGFNLKVTAAPAQSTAVSMWPVGLGVSGPVQPQLRTHGTTISSTVEPVGLMNRFSVKNSSGRDALTIWSFGRFDAWRVPANWFVGGGTATGAGPMTSSARVVPAGIGARSVVALRQS